LSEAILHAITMPEEERRRRMTKMREAVAVNNVYRWAGKFLAALTRFEFPETTPAGNGAGYGERRPPAWAA
jgi:trehalose-6-phosphate synthase